MTMGTQSGMQVHCLFCQATECFDGKSFDATLPVHILHNDLVAAFHSKQKSHPTEYAHKIIVIHWWAMMQDITLKARLVNMYTLK